MRLNLPDIRAEMEFRAGHSIILGKNRFFELLRDDHSRYQSQFSEIQARYLLNFHSTQLVFQLFVYVLGRRILLFVEVRLVVGDHRARSLPFFLTIFPSKFGGQINFFLMPVSKPLPCIKQDGLLLLLLLLFQNQGLQVLLTLS